MIDIVIFAVIAIVLIARLWAVLGERRDDDPQKPNPFAAPPVKPEDDEAKAKSEDDKVPAVPFYLPPSAFTAAPPPQSLAGALELVQKLDPAFDEKQFLQGAKAAFRLIVEDYAKGDLTRIERLLAPALLATFQQAAAARREAGEAQETVVKDVTEAEVAAARVEGPSAFVSVRFVSHQINVTRDVQGNVIAGVPEQLEEIHDLWVFRRDVASDDPNWQLVETKS
jgi:predicted lipid-binding transport protein (Tim44 family)